MRLTTLMFALTLVLAACGSDIDKGGKFVSNSSTNSANGTTNNAANNTSTNATTNNVISETCGNGALEPAETCDPAIESGEGVCPTTCSSRACTTATIIGSPAACTAECVVEPVGCIDGDGCCTEGCDSSNDSDCTNTQPVCGNGTVEAGELCDGNCPTSCPAGPTACRPNELRGSAAQCNAQCVATTITSCVSGDGCCPAGCSSAQDNDCTPNCTPDTCAQLGASCGNPPDGCGGTLQCGGCSIGACTDDFVCSNIGAPCTANGDCIAGDLDAQCLTNEPNGYCSAACNAMDGITCPAGSFCPTGNIFQPDSVCSGECTSNADCRPEYECRELTDGEPSTRTCLPVE